MRRDWVGFSTSVWEGGPEKGVHPLPWHHVLWKPPLLLYHGYGKSSIHYILSFIWVKQKWAAVILLGFYTSWCLLQCFLHMHIILIKHSEMCLCFRRWWLWSRRVPWEQRDSVWKVWRQEGACGPRHSTILFLQSETNTKNILVESNIWNRVGLCVVCKYFWTCSGFIILFLSKTCSSAEQVQFYFFVPIRKFVIGYQIKFFETNQFEHLGLLMNCHCKQQQLLLLLFLLLNIL